MASGRLIYGFHAVTSRMRSQPGSVIEILVAAERHDQRAGALLELAQSQGLRVVSVEGVRLDAMTGHAVHQGVVARVESVPVARHLDDVLESIAEPALLLVLDGIQDPHNLGACLRVADAFGAHAVIAPKDRAVGLNQTVAKVASGAAETVPYLPVTNLARTLRALKERGIWVVGSAQDGPQQIASARLDGPLAWVLGSEGAGMRRLTRELCDFTVRIPMLGAVESLNVSVSAGVCLYESRRQRG